MEGGGALWLILTVGGVVLLGLALIYGMVRNRSMTAQEKATSERATDRVYAEENRDPAN